MRLYRGVADIITDGVFVNNYLKDSRLPRDAHINVHKVADSWFFYKFGIRARSETIFCSVDIEQAKEFGQVFEISIPDGVEYKLVFSLNVIDFNEIEIAVGDVNVDEQIVEWLEDKNYKVVNNKNELPIFFKGEIMISCEKYKLRKI